MHAATSKCTPHLLLCVNVHKVAPKLMLFYICLLVHMYTNIVHMYTNIDTYMRIQQNLNSHTCTRTCTRTHTHMHSAILTLWKHRTLNDVISMSPFPSHDKTGTEGLNISDQGLPVGCWNINITQNGGQHGLIMGDNVQPTHRTCYVKTVISLSVEIMTMYLTKEWKQWLPVALCW